MKPVNISILLMILLMSMLFGCEDEDAVTNGVSLPTETDAQQNDLIIKIGNMTDLTGPGASGMEMVNMALEDTVRYCNENNMIPGVKLEAIHWDGQTDPARVIPGYEWLQHNGADVFTTCAPGVSITLKPRLETEKNVLFSQIGEMEAIEPPSYAFCLGTVPENEAYTFLKWIADNDWDYERKGPARIGAAAWAEPYAIGFIKAMKEYAEAHPDQFEFVGGYLPDFKFNWSTEIESLKDCDYIFPPIIVHEFAKSLRNTGSEARLIGGAPHTAFFDLVSEANAWQSIDGMMFIYTGGWWHEDDEMIIIQEQILDMYHQNDKERIIAKGSGYGAVYPYLMLCDIIGKAIEKTGPGEFNSVALYETAQTWSYPLAYRADYTYAPDKRYMVNDLSVMEASAQAQDLVRNNTNWYPILTEP